MAVIFAPSPNSLEHILMACGLDPLSGETIFGLILQLHSHTPTGMQENPTMHCLENTAWACIRIRDTGMIWIATTLTFPMFLKLQCANSLPVAVSYFKVQWGHLLFPRIQSNFKNIFCCIFNLEMIIIEAWFKHLGPR